MENRDNVKSVGDVVADINYFPSTGIPIPPSAWSTRYLGISYEHTRRMTIRDLRLSSQTFHLQTNGFQFIKLPPRRRVTVMDDEDKIKREYYPELEDLVQNITGASTAFAFNHVIRAHSDPSDKGIQDVKGRWQDIPSGHPHVDYSGHPEHIAATQREIDPTLPPHISALYSGSSRFAYINVWRPLSIIYKDPLAVCDCTSVPDSDYQIRLRYFNRTGISSGNYVMSHGRERNQHEWWYMSQMQDDEVVVFREYDSEMTGGWRCPHSAFQLEKTDGLKPRESIEVRLVCFWG